MEDEGPTGSSDYGIGQFQKPMTMEDAYRIKQEEKQKERELAYLKRRIDTYIHGLRPMLSTKDGNTEMTDTRKTEARHNLLNSIADGLPNLIDIDLDNQGPMGGTSSTAYGVDDDGNAYIVAVYVDRRAEEEADNRLAHVRRDRERLEMARSLNSTEE